MYIPILLILKYLFSDIQHFILESKKDGIMKFNFFQSWNSCITFSTFFTDKF